MVTATARNGRGMVTATAVLLAAAAGYGDGYVSVTADGGRAALRLDADGEGRHGEVTAWLGPWRLLEEGEAEEEGGWVGFRGAKYAAPKAATGGNSAPFDLGQDLPAGGSLGQSFTIEEGQGWLHEVRALLTCSGVDDSAVTMRLRKGGAGGEVLAERRVRPVPEQADAALRLERPLPPGTYYLELSEKHGGCYWWGCRGNVYGGGAGYVNGEEQGGVDYRFAYDLADVGVLDWGVRVEGSVIECRLELREHEIEEYEPALALSFPWERDGYDTDDPTTTPFRWLLTDAGWWFAVHAYKRIEQDWALEPVCNSFRMRGTHGYDLAVEHGRKQVLPRMDSDRLHLLVGNGARITVQGTSDELPDWFPRFFSSDPELDPLLNEFLLTFLTNHSACPSGYEWDALKLAWVGGPVHDSLERVILHYTHRIDEDGYIWSRGESRGWDGRDCSEFDSRHYDSNAPWLLACWRWYCWTGDEEFLGACIETVRKATDYLLDEMHGREGLLTIDSPGHTGSGVPGTESMPSDYWDCIPAGYQVAYINAFYAPALRASAELEGAAGNTARAEELEALVGLAERRFNEAFWDEAQGRYVEWIDSGGNVHDFGATYVNTIAATYGLADEARVRRMYEWMEGEGDTFTRWVFAPRSHTSHVHEQANRLKYEEWCEDGGAILWTAFYELMSRAEYLGADNSWARFRQVLARFAEPDHLVGGNPLYRGEVNNHGGDPGSVGTWGEFPESGIVPCVWLYGFMGVSADLEGLHFRPNLPTGLEYAGVEGLVYWGRRLTVTAYRERVVVEEGERRVEVPVVEGEAVLGEW